MMAIPILLGRTLFQAASHLLVSHGFKYDGNIAMLWCLPGPMLLTKESNYVLGLFCRFLFFHHWKLHDAGHCNLCQVCCRTCPNKRCRGSSEPNMALLYECLKDLCCCVIFGRQSSFSFATFYFETFKLVFILFLFYLFRFLSSRLWLVFYWTLWWIFPYNYLWMKAQLSPPFDTGY